MSNSIAPLPGDLGVAAMTEHHPRHDPNEYRPPDGRQADDRESAGDGRQRHEAPDTPPPAPDDETVPAETLFATTLLADAFVRTPPSRQELQLRTGSAWLPPESTLHLKDKLI